MKGELQSLKLTLAKRETEIKEVIRTLKKYSDEKKELELEVTRLNREIEVYGGHSNVQQKI
jgi:septal ring factor EnvC (AmiA/AmiB activator)